MQKDLPRILRYLRPYPRLAAVSLVLIVAVGPVTTILPLLQALASEGPT